MVDHFEVEAGILINKWDMNKEFSNKIEKFAGERNLPIVGKIPFDKRFVESLVQLKPIVEENKDYEDLFSDIIDKIGL